MNDKSEFNYGPQDFLKMKDAISDNASDIEDINDLMGTPPEGYESTIFTDLSTIEEEIGTPPEGYDSDIFTDISAIQTAITQIVPTFEKLTITGVDIAMSCGNFIIGSMSVNINLSQTSSGGNLTMGTNLPKSTHDFYVLNTNVCYNTEGTSLIPITADAMFSNTTGNCIVAYYQPNASSVSTIITVSFIGIEKEVTPAEITPTNSNTRKSTKKK